MEKICTVCGKKSSMGVTLVKLRGKYNPTSKVRKYPNLQWTKLPASRPASTAKRGEQGGPSGKRVLACAKCIKRMAKV